MLKKIKMNHGVTLIELLVAIALSLVVMVPAFTFLVNSMQSADLEQNRIEVTEIARSTIHDLSDSIRKAIPSDVLIIENYYNSSVALKIGTNYVFLKDQKLVVGDKDIANSLSVFQENISSFNVTAIEGTSAEPKAIKIEFVVINDNNIEKTVETTVFIRGGRGD